MGATIPVAWREAEERLDKVLDAIAAERERQEQLFAAGEFEIHVSDPATPHRDRFLVLGEEFGEVAEALQRPGRLSARWHDHLRQELVQLAAVATAWVEALDSGNCGAHFPGNP